MTTLQTVTLRRVTITHLENKKPHKIRNILQELGLMKKGENTSHMSEKHDDMLYR